MRDEEAGITRCMTEWCMKWETEGKIEMVNGEG
jgi:hypothetical protein